MINWLCLCFASFFVSVNLFIRKKRFVCKDGNEWQICYSNIHTHYSNVFEHSNIRIEKSSMISLRFQLRRDVKSKFPYPFANAKT